MLSDMETFIYSHNLIENNFLFFNTRSHIYLRIPSLINSFEKKVIVAINSLTSDILFLNNFIYS